jgi:hypothetical protein
MTPPPPPPLPQNLALQASHARFVDELDEPSSKLGSTRLDLRDPTALYTFSVGRHGHPFHRHQGHRVVVAISGSGGADLRFSPATPSDPATLGAAFVAGLRCVRIPADCLFTMRFDGRVWHQFAPTPCPTGIVAPLNPAFFALSVHTDETGGHLDARLRALVAQDAATIASLTELLPAAVLASVDVGAAVAAAPLTQLSLETSLGNEKACRFVRGSVGVVRGTVARSRSVRAQRAGAGFALTQIQGTERWADGAHFVVTPVVGGWASLPPWLAQWALSSVLPAASHEDVFTMAVPIFARVTDIADMTAGDRALEAILCGFIENPPVGVGRLQKLRNILVRPLGLRVSPLGCPVSSLLAKQSITRFGAYNQFPVHAVYRDPAAPTHRVAVVLGADDRHLRFRTVVAVDVTSQLVYMSTRVEPLNVFGEFYYACIDGAHRRFVAPNLLRWAGAFATAQLVNA